MNRAQFDLAINWLREQDPPLILPFAATPGELPGGDAETFTEETWNEYRWNPPGAQAHEEGAFDDDASAKPTWAMLAAAVASAELAQARERAIADLKVLCRRKVTSAYGALSHEEEVHLRLRRGETAAQNTERDRLRGLFQTQKTAINAATTTAAVENLLTAALADSFWAPPAAD